MEIREKKSLFALYAQSFAVANRALLTLIGSFFVFLLIIAIPTAVVFLVHNFFLLLLWQLFFFVCVTWWTTACVRIIAAQAEKTRETISDCFFNSLVPTFYLIVFQLIVNVVAGVAGFVSAFIPIIGPLLMLFPFVYFTIRLMMFGPLSIILREQGPIAAFAYSWQLTSGRFWYVFGASLLACGLYVLVIGAVLYGIVVGIPLYFADSFSLANLSAGWILVFSLIALFFLFMVVSLYTFFVLLFLHVDFENVNGSMPDEPYQPLPYQSFPNQPDPLYVTPSNTMPQREAAPSPVVFQEVPHVDVIQASVKSEADNDELHRHLDQVYTPRQEADVEYAEEDRMPTILFDDEMAKQLEERQNMLHQQTAKYKQNTKEDEDHGTSSIKMSK